MFLKHFHILFTCAPPFVPASGLRLEITTKRDKKKSELYFLLSVKKFLTKKIKTALPQVTQISPTDAWLTKSMTARIFGASARASRAFDTHRG
jgi:hypothetical protein